MINRSSENVIGTLTEARIKLNELSSVHYSLCCSAKSSKSNLKLLEIPAKLIDQLQSPKSLIVRGFLSDNAICCLRDQTFLLRGAETSNTLLLSDAINLSEIEYSASDSHVFKNVELKQCLKSYVDMMQTASQLVRLKDILNSHPYHGQLHNISLDYAGCTTEELLDSIQCNHVDLLRALEKLNAIKIEDRWIIPQIEHYIAIFESCLPAELAGSVSFDDIVDRLSTKFSPKKFLHAIIAKLFLKNDSNLSLNVDFISKLYAIVLLASVKSMKLKDFFDVWQNSIPGNIHPSLSCLEGVAFVFDDSICYLDQFDFPEDFRERLNILFNIKRSLTLNEIRPYLLDVVIDDAEMMRLLSQITHSYICNGEKFYCKKN